MKLIFALSAFLVAVVADATAQYSEESFEQKVASDLYDERGYAQGSAISVDGNLIVSNANGNVSYSYPLSSWMKGGHSFGVSLNYCGSVAFTTYGRWDQDNEIESHYGFGWSRFSQNRPLWIVGFNGFAVQALSTSLSFHASSAQISGRFADENVTVYDDEDFVWAIDGYDICNRMVDFRTGVPQEVGGIEQYHDIIRILRADGSLMTLVNTTFEGQEGADRWNGSFAETGALYTGYYVHGEANEPGFGFVEYQETTGKYFHPAEQAFFSKYGLLNEAHFRPRILTYYPGDGLEYRFVERFNPYGMSDISSGTNTFGGLRAGPTIFYLREVRSTSGTLAVVDYSRQQTVVASSPGYWTPYTPYDSTVGRALALRIDETYLSYGDGWMMVQADGRTTTVRFDEVVSSGDSTYGAHYLPLATYGYLNSTSLALSELPITWYGLYKSCVGYVTSITDPEGRETTFEYDDYTRSWRGVGFPRSYSTFVLKLDNKRLSEVHEPSSSQYLTYRRDRGESPVAPDLPDTMEIAMGPDVHYYRYGMSNFVDSVVKKDRAGNPLTSTRYLYLDFHGTRVSSPLWTQVIQRDFLTGLRTETDYQYDQVELPNTFRFPSDPVKVRTNLVGVSSVAFQGNAPIWYESSFTGYQSVTPFLWMPNLEVLKANGIIKRRLDYEYEIDTVRTFGGDSLYISNYGGEISRVRKLVAIRNVDTHYIETSVFLNFPLTDTTLIIDYYEEDKLTMFRKWDSLRSLGDPIQYVEWRIAKYDPRIYTTRPWSDTFEYRIIPQYGLPLSTWRSSASGDFLQGKSNRYCVLGDCPLDTNAFANIPSATMLGSILQDTTFGRNRVIGGLTTYGYKEWFPLLPSTVINTLGARRSSLVSLASTAGDLVGAIQANDKLTYSGTLRNSSHFARRTGQPQLLVDEVRKHVPFTTTLKVDTFETRRQLTHYGQVAKAIDANGWMSEFQYDNIGRLEYAWLPRDFQSPDSIYIVPVQGVQKLLSQSSSSWTDHTDTVHCDTTTSGTGLSLDLEFAHMGRLMCNRPLKIVPRCTGGNDTLATDQKGVTTASFGNDPIPYEWRTPAVAQAKFRMPDSVSSLIVAHADFYVSNLIGECVTLEVSMDAYPGFSATYVLNCPTLNGGSSSNSIGQLNDPVSVHALEKASVRSASLYTDTLNGVARVRVEFGEYMDSIMDDDFVILKLETQTPGAEIEFVSEMTSADETAPTLFLNGQFFWYNRVADYTLAFTHDDENLTTTMTAKLDDEGFTSNVGVVGQATLGASRRTAVTHEFGADYRLLRSITPIGSLLSPVRYDSIVARYDGAGGVRTAIDQERDSVTTTRDAWGRADTIYNQDSTFITIEYYQCPEWDPEPQSIGNGDGCFGIYVTDQDLYGYVLAKVTTNENGVKFVEYYDAFDRLRREVADSGGMHLITKYEYDVLGRLKEVTNPAGQVITYWYDDFGNVQYKQQGDLGTISYAYDKLGNVRFSQTQEQSDESRMTFFEYDDLNRLYLVGEADFFDPEPGHSIGEGGESGGDRTGRGEGVAGEVVSVSEKGSLPGTASVPGDPTLNLSRLTDLISPDTLHNSQYLPILTANRTLWMEALFPKVVPSFWDTWTMMDTVDRDCADLTQAFPEAIGPFLVHEADTWVPTNEISTYDDFEHLRLHPENARIAIHYDELPSSYGAVWVHFPPDSIWASLTPYDTIRNLRGREVAVAYREHGGQPYHFTVMSYDERGRPEALLRFTENLGFEAIHYEYNSMNKLIRITAADPLRRHTTWYGYDHNGRVDSVWTAVDTVGSGTLLHGKPNDWGLENYMQLRPVEASITYTYTPTGKVDTMYYPQINVATWYHYTPRKWLDTLVATNGLVDLFRQELSYNNVGHITKQYSEQDGATPNTQLYGYDAIGQLKTWSLNPLDIFNGTVQVYGYDDVGNRTSTTDFQGDPSTLQGSQSYSIGPDVSNPTAGPNQLLKVQSYDATPAATDYTTFAYDPDGSMTVRTQYDPLGAPLFENRYSYSSWRGLTTGFEQEHLPPPPAPPLVWTWEYRYNAMGEREQKREMQSPAGANSLPGHSWSYYLLNGTKEQLSMWRGAETGSAGTCSWALDQVAYLYPAEYLVYAVEYPGIREDIPRLSLTPDGEVEYRITDHLASVRQTLDGSGQTVNQVDYEPFGAVLSSQGVERKGFNSRDLDQEDGQLNNGARKYYPLLGRFVAIDVLWTRFPQFSPYMYAYNSPIVVSDPSGKQGVSEGKTLNISYESDFIDQVLLAMIVHSATGTQGFEALDRESDAAGVDVEIVVGDLSGDTDYQGTDEDGLITAGGTRVEVSANASPIGPGVERTNIENEDVLRDLSYPGRDINLHKVTIVIDKGAIEAKARSMAGEGSIEDLVVVLTAAVIAHEVQHGLEAIRGISEFLVRARNDIGVPHAQRQAEEFPINQQNTVEREMLDGMRD